MGKEREERVTLIKPKLRVGKGKNLWAEEEMKLANGG